MTQQTATEVKEIPVMQQRAMAKLIGKPYVLKVPTTTHDVAQVLKAQDKRARKAAKRLA